MAAPVAFCELSGKHLQSKRNSAYKTSLFDDIAQIDYQQFFHEYLVPNKPCLFDQSVTKHWKSRRDWVTADGTPDFEFLKNNFGEATVPVANCKQEQYSSHPKQDLTLDEYLTYWEEYRVKGYPEGLPCLYLKDWHFTKVFQQYEAYRTPVYFQSDWLNEFWDTLPQDDYRFVYMGPKGTWTPFHSDVYRSFSWSANICGKKKWIFYPPGCEDHLKDKFGNLVYDVTSPSLENSQEYPDSDKVKGQGLEVIQREGQIIFVPSGWHHQVYNLEDTISINHNWLNGCNIDICWRHLQDNLKSVKHEIRDVRNMEGWHEQCQIVLNADAGINYEVFIQLLKVIAINRLNKLGKQSKVNTEKEVVNDKNVESDDSDKLQDAQIITTPDCDRCLEKCIRKLEETSTNSEHSDFNIDYNLSEISRREYVSMKRDGMNFNLNTTSGTCSVDGKTFLGNPEDIKTSGPETPDCLAENAQDNCNFKYYIFYDLSRIRETLVDIMNDEDYKELTFKNENTAEYVYEIINSKLDP